MDVCIERRRLRLFDHKCRKSSKVGQLLSIVLVLGARWLRRRIIFMPHRLLAEGGIHVQQFLN